MIYTYYQPRRKHRVMGTLAVLGYACLIVSLVVLKIMDII